MNCRCAYEPLPHTLYAEVLAMQQQSTTFEPFAHAQLSLHPTDMKTKSGETVYSNGDGIFFVCRKGLMVLINLNTLIQNYSPTPARPLKEITLDEVLEMKKDIEDSKVFGPWISQGTISVKATELCNIKGERIFMDEKGHMYVRRENFFYANEDEVKVPPLPGPDDPFIPTTMHNERYVPFSKRTEAEKRGIIGVDPASGPDKSVVTKVVVDEAADLPPVVWAMKDGPLPPMVFGTKLVEPLPPPLPITSSGFEFTMKDIKVSKEKWLAFDKRFSEYMRERMNKWADLYPAHPTTKTPAELAESLMDVKLYEGQKRIINETVEQVYIGAPTDEKTVFEQRFEELCKSVSVPESVFLGEPTPPPFPEDARWRIMHRSYLIERARIDGKEVDVGPVMPSVGLKTGEAMEKRFIQGQTRWFFIPLEIKQELKPGDIHPTILCDLGDDDCPAPTIIGG